MKLKMEKVKIQTLEDVFGKEEVEKWLSTYSVLRNENVRKWLENKLDRYTRNGKDGKNFQVTSYLTPFQKYCNYYKVENPSDLLKENIDDRNKRLVNYLRDLIKAGENEASVRNAYQSRIKSFYSARGSPISDGLETLSSGINKNEIILDKEQIQLIQAKLERAEYRFILKCQALLGLRISDVLNELTTSKNGEAKYKIEKYSNHFHVKNFWTKKENVIINFLFFPKELTTLLQSIHNISDLRKLDLRDILLTRRKTRINKYDYLARIKDICNELGIEENIKTHSFRKYFSNQISSTNLLKYNDKMGADLEGIFKEHLMGHKGKNLSESYKQKLKRIKWFYENWKPLEQSICIDCEIYDNTSKEILNLKDKYDKLVEKDIEKDKEVNELKETMKTFFEAFLKMKGIVIEMNDSYRDDYKMELLKDNIKDEKLSKELAEKFEYIDKEKYREYGEAWKTVEDLTKKLRERIYKEK